MNDYFLTQLQSLPIHEAQSLWEEVRGLPLDKVVSVRGEDVPGQDVQVRIVSMTIAEEIGYIHSGGMWSYFSPWEVLVLWLNNAHKEALLINEVVS